jgi:hypothetical protein
MNEVFGKAAIDGAAEANRNEDRDSLFLKAILRFPTSDVEGEVRIRNLSAGGLMAEAPVRVARGEKVEINLRTIGWISGSVAWVTEGRLGIAFDYPIDPKAARNSVGNNNVELPHYLQKLDQVVTKATDPSKLRRI